MEAALAIVGDNNGTSGYKNTHIKFHLKWNSIYRRIENHMNFNGLRILLIFYNNISNLDNCYGLFSYVLNEEIYFHLLCEVKALCICYCIWYSLLINLMDRMKEGNTHLIRFRAIEMKILFIHGPKTTSLFWVNGSHATFSRYSNAFCAPSHLRLFLFFFFFFNKTSFYFSAFTISNIERDILFES